MIDAPIPTAGRDRGIWGRACVRALHGCNSGKPRPEGLNDRCRVGRGRTSSLRLGLLDRGLLDVFEAGLHLLELFAELLGLFLELSLVLLGLLFEHRL